jgi:hypothetical protein
VDEAGGGSPDTDKASSAVAAARFGIEGTIGVSMVIAVFADELF